MILRYDDVERILTKRDPFDDICNWISGLRSSGYTRDVLAQKHGFTNAKATREAADAIRAHTETALNLLDQSEKSAPEVSFLPLYYSLLNLSKIYIILSGKLSDLNSQRWHGATYSGATKASQDLMTDTVTIKSKGAIPLLYKVITGSPIPRSSVTLKLIDVYPFIVQINYEFKQLYGGQETLEPIQVELGKDPADAYRLVAVMTRQGQAPAPKKNLRVLSSFRADSQRPNMFVTPAVAADEASARTRLLGDLRRYLLYTQTDALGNPLTLTPISNRQFLWAEEIPILLALFHMSNVVRYNPQFLDRVQDSKAWTLLLAFRNHATLTFLELLWSFVMKKAFLIMR